MGISVANSSSLSAMGSSSLPRSVTWLRERARYPSYTSLIAATRKMKNAISLGQYPSMNGSSAMTGVKQIRTRVMMLGTVHMSAPLPQGLDDALADRLEGIEHAFARDGHGLEIRRPLDPLSVLLGHQVFRLAI